MAAEVSCLVNGSGRNSSEILITRDLLGGLSNSSNGGSGSSSSKKLDLDLHLPPRAWELQMERRRRQGEVNLLQETDHESSSSSNLEDLELKLVPDNPITHQHMSFSCYSYTTVCTLDKVKSALQRAENQNINNHKKRRSMSSSPSPPPPPPSTVGIGIAKDNEEAESITNTPNDAVEEQLIKSGGSSSSGGGVMFAAGCPGCLLYVITSKTNPKCPHCNSKVPTPLPLPLPPKKPRFDLNASFS